MKQIDLILGLVRRVTAVIGLGLFVITLLVMFIRFIFVDLIVIVRLMDTEKPQSKGLEGI